MNKEDIKKSLEAFEESYKKKLLSNSEAPKYDLTERLKGIYENVAEKIVKKCKKEIEELNQYLENDFLSDKEIKPLPGKEDLAKEYYSKFYICSYYPNTIINKLETITVFSSNLNSEQLNHCKEDCINNLNYDSNLEIGKLCVKKCLDFSFNYSRKATIDLLDKILENVEKDIKLL